MKATFSKDFLASIVVFLVALPLCLGIAIASGMPPAAGLMTGMIGGIVAGMLAGSPMQVSGPAAGLAVFTYQLVQERGVAMLGLLVLVAGVFQLIAGLLKFGQLFRAISPSVIHGMLAGIGILIFGAQFHVMVDDAPRSGGLQNLLAIPESIMKAVSPIEGKAHHWAALIGAATLLTLIAWNMLAPKKLRLIPGALVAVLMAMWVAAVFKLPINFVQVPDSLAAAVQMPDFTKLSSLLFDPALLIDAFAIAFVASAETLLCAAAVDQMHSGPRTKYDKELAAQGVGNMLCGLVGGLPMTGVIVRSSANVLAGAKTRYSAVMHGVWMIALVVAFPGVLRMVPTASLAAILVYTGYKLVNPQHIKHLWHYGAAPLAVYFITMITIVSTDMLTGILVGLALSLAKLVYALTHMGVRVEDKAGRTDIYLSGAATFVRLPKFVDALEEVPGDSEAHVHFKNLDYIDHACMDALKAWEGKRLEKGQPVNVEWDELMGMYRSRNAMKRTKKSADEAKNPDPAVAA